MTVTYHILDTKAVSFYTKIPPTLLLNANKETVGENSLALTMFIHF
jgi:hypothetical protein